MRPPVVFATILLVAIVSGSAAARVATTSKQTAAPKVTVTMSESAYKLSPAKVPSGAVSFVLVNKGKKPHFFGVAGSTSKPVRPGKRADFRVTFKKAGTFK